MRRGARGGRAEVDLGCGVGRTSIACFRSSSTVARVESFSSWVIFAAIIGTLIRRALSVKLALYVNVSVGSTSFPAGSFVKILYLPTHSDITYLEGGGGGRGE